MDTDSGKDQSIPCKQESSVNMLSIPESEDQNVIEGGGRQDEDEKRVKEEH